MNDWTIFATTHITGPLKGHARRWAPVAVFLASLLVLVVIGAIAALRPGAQAKPEQRPIIMLATVAPAPTVAPSRAIIGYFDYANVGTAAALNAADVVRVIGQAGDWRLVTTAQNGQVWIAAGNVPAGVLADSPLADLSPPTAAPPPIVIYVPAAPVVEPTAETHFEMPSDRPGPPLEATPPPLLEGERLDEYFKRLGITAIPVQQVR
jgi:hypothetical protein